MKAGTRRVLIWGLLALTLVAAVWPEPDIDVAAPVKRAPRIDPTASSVSRATGPVGSQTSSGDVTLEHNARSSVTQVETNPFAVRTWVVAQPPAPTPPPAVKAEPVAPPLPFAYAGKLEVEPGNWVFYLVRGEQSFAVSKGDVFDSVYRFDGLENGSLLIQYLPLSTPQRLRLNP